MRNVSSSRSGATLSNSSERRLKQSLGTLAAWLALAVTAPAAQARPVLVELFTSQACSSCPPADALLGTLANDPGVLPLSFNVTYWNSAAYTDPYALQQATDRQSWYAGLEGSQDVYTPQAVVDGRTQFVGSDQGKLTSAVAAAKASPAGDIRITLGTGPMLTITIPAGAGGADLMLFGYDPSHTTPVDGGENAGATITETNVVRSVTNLGTWTGAAMSMTIARPMGEHVAAILQTPQGAVLGAAAQ
jgi:hypothetical protein